MMNFSKKIIFCSECTIGGLKKKDFMLKRLSKPQKQKAIFFKLQKRVKQEKLKNAEFDIQNKSTNIHSTKETDISISRAPSRTYCDSFLGNRNIPDIYENRPKNISKFSIPKNPKKSHKNQYLDSFWMNSSAKSTQRRRNGSRKNSVDRIKTPSIQRVIQSIHSPMRSFQKDRENYTISVNVSSFNADSKLVTQASLYS